MDRKHQHVVLLAWLRRTLPATAAALAGCRGVQSTLDPMGPAAAAIARSWWLMAGGATVILALVTGLGLWAVYRNADRRRAPSPRLLILGGGLVLPAVVLTALLVHGLQLMARATPGEAALQVQVVAHRWWWEVRYPGAGGVQRVGANELRIPAGRPVQVNLSSRDVIHSFWVPQLAGKMDVIPGHERRHVIEASQPGRFRGQCAEFCGEQHALMVLWVVAMPAEDFERWLAGTDAAGGPR